MTNKEAIEILKRGASYSEVDSEKFCEAFDMAIEALSCSEKPNRSDLISRQDIYDLIDNWDEPMISKRAFRCDVEDLPSAPEIIRYKDCCHYPSKYSDCPMIGWAKNENDFCSKAERKDNDTKS